jgi:hypothetical protein
VAYFLSKNGRPRVRDIILTLSNQCIHRSWEAYAALEVLKLSHFRIEGNLGVRFLFTKVLQEPACPVYVVLDGLDEADTTTKDIAERETEMDIFIECLANLPSIRLLVVSRLEVAISRIHPTLTIKS